MSVNRFPTVCWGNRQVTFRARRNWRGLKPLTAVLVFAFFNERVVLVDIEGRGWSIPSGHILEGETPLQAIRREAMEEAGIMLYERIEPIGVYHILEQDGSQWYSLTYVAEVAHFQPIPDTSESRGVLLMYPEDVQEVYYVWDPLIAQVFQYALNQYRERFRPGVSVREVFEQFARVPPAQEEV